MVQVQDIIICNTKGQRFTLESMGLDTIDFNAIIMETEPLNKHELGRVICNKLNSTSSVKYSNWQLNYSQMLFWDNNNVYLDASSEPGEYWYLTIKIAGEY